MISCNSAKTNPWRIDGDGGTDRFQSEGFDVLLNGVL